MGPSLARETPIVATLRQVAGPVLWALFSPPHRFYFRGLRRSFGRLYLTLQAIWLEDPLDMVDEEDSSIFGQFASIFFVDVDAGPDVFGASTVDARLPYERVTPTANTLFTTTQNDMVRREASESFPILRGPKRVKGYCAAGAIVYAFI